MYEGHKTTELPHLLVLVLAHEVIPASPQLVKQVLSCLTLHWVFPRDGSNLGLGFLC